MSYGTREVCATDSTACGQAVYHGLFCQAATLIMYPSHWGLSRSPFGPQLDPRFFFASPGHEEALARMHFLIEEHRRLGLLLGPSGCGKSLLLEIIARRVRAWGRAAVKMSLLGAQPEDFLATVVDELHLVVPENAPIWRTWQYLERRLRENRYQQLETVLLLDDADQASPEVLTQVARIAKYDLVPNSRLTLVLAGQANRIASIGEALLDLAELRIDVPAWEPGDTEGFLHRSLEQAGGHGTVIGHEAAQRMHELAGGSPRRVRQLADLALLAAAGNNLEVVDVNTVDAACEQLGVMMPSCQPG